MILVSLLRSVRAVSNIGYILKQVSPRVVQQWWPEWWEKRGCKRGGLREEQDFVEVSQRLRPGVGLSQHVLLAGLRHSWHRQRFLNVCSSG